MQRINTLNYPIYIGHNIAKQAFLSPVDQNVLICDDRIKDLYAAQFKDLCPLTLSVPPGEQSKTREMKQVLEDRLLENQFLRKTRIYALGGGVITDLGGFLAATYCRGVEFVSIPCSLLAMVDSSIGGKTGVNTPWGKNLIGQIYFPQSVWIDVAFLASLPKKELSHGMAEVIKHAALFDQNFWQWLITESTSLLSLDTDSLIHMIKRSVELKNEVVSIDPFEKKERMLLNFGHTFGHGIELASHYAIAHGEAVAYGMVLEALALGRPIEMLLACFKQYGLLSRGDLSDLDRDACIAAMRHDKKNKEGQIRIVNWQSIGKVDLPIAVDEQKINAAFQHLSDYL